MLPKNPTPADLAAQALGMSDNLAVDSAGQRPQQPPPSPKDPSLDELVEWGKKRAMTAVQETRPAPLGSISADGRGAIVRFITPESFEDPRTFFSQDWRKLHGADTEIVTFENYTLLLDEWRKERAAQEPGELPPEVRAGIRNLLDSLKPKPQPILSVIHRDTMPENPDAKPAAELPVLPPHKPKSAPPPERICPKFRLGDHVYNKANGKEETVRAIHAGDEPHHMLYATVGQFWCWAGQHGASQLKWQPESDLVPIHDHLAAELARTENEAAALRERLAGLDQEGAKAT